jgi:DNA modification methylase
MEINKIYNEPCLDTLKHMPNDFLDCVITSPPYWQLRDYGYDGQWGLEPTFNQYLENLWSMMDEIYRVLKPTGTVWINLGDTYQRSNKCLLLIPHRFAIGCIDRGWIVRNDIIWAKRNGMPESVTDRFSKKHEYFFFMVKSESYFFDLDAIRDKVKFDLIKMNESSFIDVNYNITSESKYKSIDIEKIHRQGMHKKRGENIIEKRPNLPTQLEFVNFLKKRIKMNVLIESLDIPKTTIEHWFRNDIKGFSYPSIEHWGLIKDYLDNWDDEFEIMDEKMTFVIYETDDINKNLEKGKNPGDVSDFWDIPTKPNKESHYAQYHDELIRKPIIAGCPENGLIYDPFMGSGSTAEACIRAKRNYIGSEMSLEYLDIANKRLEQHKKQLKLL